MKLFGLDISLSRKAETMSLDTLIRRLEAIHETTSGIAVNPETAMRSPTVAAIVTAISRRIATLPVHVLRKTTVKDRVRKEALPNHPVARLLQSPNDWQDRVSFWLDATSWLVRYGNFYAFKARGQTGPIRRLMPLPAGHVQVKQDETTLAVTYEAMLAGGVSREIPAGQMLHARGAARDGIVGDSPISDIREAIALEIAAEKMGAAVFGNSALPSIIFQFAQGSQGFKTDEERASFIENFQNIYARKGRFKALLLPKGIEAGNPIPVDNEKAQFLATRQYQRTVIAGAFGVPPHLVGDLSRGTYSNVEQQSLDFIQNVVLPYVRIFEAAMERSLLTDEDRRSGVQIRFNLDGALRADFLTRQQGLQIQRQNGIINSNSWREMEGMNPISEADGGEEYYRQGPSGQSANPSSSSNTSSAEEAETDTSKNGNSQGNDDEDA